ncbi:MAG: LytTR family DNA-binding domain-containing protein [Rikenellaceae bacterium]
MRLKTIVIDDEPLALGLIESYVAKTPFLEHIASFYSGIEAVHSEKLAEADLIFLDIQMPTLSGLELSRMVKAETRIIFTTAFNQYALDGYRVNALDYLLKPISYLDFLTSANKALSWFELVERANGVESESELDSIYVKSEYKLLRIELDRLIYVEGLKDYVKFYVEGESRPILSLMSIKRAVDLLPESQFIRVNRSFIVRKDKIKVIERSRIVIGNVYIPIGEAYRDQLQSYLKLRSL